MAILPGLVADDTIDADLRVQQQLVYSALFTPRQAGERRPDLTSVQDRFSQRFTLHLADFDLEGNDAMVDVVFDNGFATRCAVLGQAVTTCSPISDRFETWMQALVSDALEIGEPSRLEEYTARLAFRSETVDKIAAQQGRLSTDFTITREVQRGGWVIMAARFSARQQLDCTFYDSQPVILHDCRFR